MEELLSIGTNIATIIAIGVSVVSGIIVAYAGFQYATASGDPQKIGLAKSSFIGAFIGLIIASLAFIGPRIVTDMVIKPVGGVAVDAEVGLNCDGILRNQLVFQRAASTAERMNIVISQVQSQRSECSSDVWSPKVIDIGTSAGKCFHATAGTQGTNSAKVGGADVPDGLKIGGGSGKVRKASGRDSANNIIVYWDDDVSKRPSDGSSCWLYMSRLRNWHENFY